MSVEIKAAVSVAEMARMVGLSRARFYQLIGSAFPHPVYCVSTRRPFYDQLLQESCLEVRRRNCGIDGKPILFYSRRSPARSARSRPSKVGTQKLSPHADLLAGLKSLGLLAASSEITDAMATLFPHGTADIEPSELLRTVFVHLKTRAS